MTEKVRVGVIGTSWWADGMHLPNLKSHPGAEIVAICGRDHDCAAEMAAKYEIPRVFADYREMIEKGDLHALVVVAPDDQHYRMTMDGLEAGLHVLCEKPLALNAGHAREMYEMAERAGVKHMTFFTYRWHPTFRYLRQLVDEGYVGRCFHFQVSFLGGYGRKAQYGWRFDGQRSNGMLGDLGAHMIDLARWYVGEISQVSALLTTFVQRPGAAGQVLDPANDSAVLAIEFENGAQGMIHVSAMAHQAERWVGLRLTLYGEAGTLEADYDMGTRSEIRGARHDDESFEVLPVPDHLWGGVKQSTPWDELEEVFTTRSAGARLFIDAIIEDRPVSPSFYDGLKAQEVIDAAVESHRGGYWVSL